MNFKIMTAVVAALCFSVSFFVQAEDLLPEGNSYAEEYGDLR